MSWISRILKGVTGSFGEKVAGVVDELDDNSNYRTMLDLTDMKEWRLITVQVDGDGTAICELGVQYSPDNFATWRGLDNGNTGSLSTTSNQCDVASHDVTAWTSLNATAQADVWLRIGGIDDGDITTDPDFGTIQVQFRSTV